MDTDLNLPTNAPIVHHASQEQDINLKINSPQIWLLHLFLPTFKFILTKIFTSIICTLKEQK